MTADTLADGKRFEFWETETRFHKTLYVDALNPNASDENDGSEAAPFRTIQAAADVAQPGTRVQIMPGVYRECVRPRRGGTGPDQMIVYEAQKPGTVVIKASEEVTDFEESRGWRLWDYGQTAAEVAGAKIWCHKLNPKQFMGYNPFCAVNILHDRLFIEYEKTDMTTYLNRRGMIFCDGKPLTQVPLYNRMSAQTGTYWVEANGQTVHFRLENDDNPANHCIEISCREQCFAPEEPFLNYIKVKGIVCAHASMGAPVPQRGAISAYRGHHWVIEDCTIDWSNAVGIDIGFECWHHEFDPQLTIGHSVIRRCHIKDAGVCGIAGLFATHMLIEDNLIEGTGWQKMELSWEAGGIKLHNSIDGLFRRNIFKRTYRADHLWLDCGNVNNRITQNLFLDGIEQREAIFIECTREGINLIDNNIFWNIEGRFDPTKIPEEPGSTGWYKLVENESVNGYAVYGEGTDRMQLLHNLIGKCRGSGYYAKPVPFRISPGQRGGTSRDARIFNNIFYDCKEAAITFPTEKNAADGNLYVKQTNGGYLRVMYPAPEACLDLKSWTEFYGFDREGAEAWFDIEVNTDTYELTLHKSSQEAPGLMFGEVNRYLTAISEVSKVTADERMTTDLLGAAQSAGEVLPGPLVTLEENVVYSIDPRRKVEGDHE